VTSFFFGRPNLLAIGGNAATVEMNSADGREKLQLWSDVDAAVPDRVTQSMWVSLCREALTHGNDLTVVIEDENSAQVVSIHLKPPPG